MSTYMTYLMIKEDGKSWEKLADIKDTPDLVGEPNQLETTSLSDPAQTFITGISQSEVKPFTLNYTKDNYEKLLENEGKELDVAVWFGADKEGNPTGQDGVFEGRGSYFISVAGGGVDEVREMTINFSLSKAFQYNKQPTTGDSPQQ